ncbi:FadR/GntR family transcriptional regulator [Gephyromycinifex aptenodytis]|uniref:FadR/GntR family transcriptional regulator n=1 Tax=Gephyromycinifex aptenodytis TaxID=2716227 RepID=UPI0014455DA8|nr:FadR/GntR family transcriptional regulator [Gephyromycinifex aptenodytis]
MDSHLHIERTSVHAQIADHLRRLIVSGELQPGVALPGERELAARFEVSRNSLRQAIAYLEAMGLVETRHGAGVFVSDGSSTSTVARLADVLLHPNRSLLNVVEARILLEPQVASLAAQRRTEEDLVEIRRFALVPHGKDPSVTPGNFHPRVARATRNPVLIGIERALTTGPVSVTVLLEFEPECMTAWDRAHQEIYLAIKDQDPANAELLMKNHLQDVLAVTRRHSEAQAT